MDRGAWAAIVHRVTESDTIEHKQSQDDVRLKSGNSAWHTAILHE